MYFDIKIDANIKIPDNLIKADHMYDFENYLYKTLQEMKDFNSKNNSSQEQNDKIFEENLKLNSRLINMTIFECVGIMVMASIQYLVLKNYIKNKI